MHAQTVKDFITEYLKQNSHWLGEKYPGLSSRRLLQEYLYFSGHKEEEYFVRPRSEFFIKLEQGVPLEYINHNAFFFEHNFYVDESVLIPRSETELLVANVVDYLKANSHVTKICEIGVGSGAIMLSILAKVKRPFHVVGVDISEAALEIARKNFFRLHNCIHPMARMNLYHSDRLSKIKDKFELIMSNPPYIKEKADIDQVHPQVLQFEPKVALFLKDEEYTEWFEYLFEQTSRSLVSGGRFIMEGHENSLEELQQLALKFFSKVVLNNDLTGRLRFLEATL